MRVRYYFRCQNCQTSILTRVGIGYGVTETFRFVCPKCAQDIHGEIPLDQKNIKIGRLRGLTGADEISEVATPDYEVDHQAGFASRPGAASVASPFLSAFGRHRGAAERHLFQQAWFVRMSEDDIALLKRVIRNYTRGQYDLAATALRTKDLEVEPDGRAIRGAIQAVLEGVFAPIAGSSRRTEFIGSLSVKLAAIADDSQQCASLRSECELLRIDLCLHDLLDLYLRFLKTRMEYQTALLEFEPEEPERLFPNGLSVGYGTDVDGQKRFYADAYEAFARSLTFITAIENWAERGAYSSYPPHPDARTKFHPKSLAQFASADHGAKVTYLSGWPMVGPCVSVAMDRALRNAIGHHSLRLDLAEETLDYPVDRKGVTRTRISLGEFELKCLRVLTGVHYASRATAMIIDAITR